MSVSAAMVMSLRERTGAGMMECKKFLVAANGDIELAIIEMRKAGQAKADKKADRIAAEGVVVVARTKDLRHSVILEINSETDFAARDESFVRFAQLAVETALQTKVTTVDDLSQQMLVEGNITVEQARQELVAKIGENIKIRRLHHAQADEGGVTGFYLHGGRIGVVIVLKGGDNELARDLGMHIAASRPIVVKREEVSAQLIERERDIFIAQARDSGKPQDIIDKMIDGRISKYLDEVSLYGQPFVKDPNTKVGQLLKQKQVEVVSFTRFEVGEGIEKKEDNFVAEVMAQVRESS
jgi:elongation factor Ts